MHALARRLMLAGVVIALIGGASELPAQGPSASPESVGFSADGLNTLRQTMRGLVADGKLAGVTTLVARHGKIVYIDAYGVQDLVTQKPVGRDTIFRLASMTKPIVGVAMMMLWEQGKWTLDDPVAKHIPEFAGLKVATPNGEVPQATPMTMRQLMSHTAGFDVTAGYANANLGDRDQPLQSMIDKLAKLPLAVQPGTDWRYGPSVDIQGYIVEKLSGQSLDVFLRTRIFEPLGMKDTGFWVDASKVDRVTSVFTYGPDKRLIRATPPPGQEKRYDDPSAKPVFLSGSVGLLSTTDDYFQFAQMMLNGGEANGKRFLKTSTVELMRTNVLAEGVSVDNYGPARPGIGFGLDFAIVMDPAAANTPEGRNSFYWGGAFGTWFWIDPTNDVVVVGMMQNVGGSLPTGGSPQVRPQSRQLVYQALVDPTK
ncbi:MAG TPA: serine hydrolase domain-containing protein [Vicinamibacterales bacterium]|nr:serine hydrolase domain-containing protein [Vicinamibacterales bacterium]